MINIIEGGKAKTLIFILFSYLYFLTILVSIHEYQLLKANLT